MAVSARSCSQTRRFDMREIIKLNLGCGPDVRPGFRNIDVVWRPGVFTYDLSNFPWPFDDGEVDYVVANHFLEHTEDLLRTLCEVHRILRPGGVFEIEVPYATNHTWQGDLTHRQHFCLRSFMNWEHGKNADRTHLNMPMSWHVDRPRLSFLWGSSPAKRLFNRIVDPVINAAPFFYERALMPIFPASIIRYRLTKPV